MTPDKITRIVCSEFNITPSEIMNPTRKPEILTPRQILTYFINLKYGEKQAVDYIGFDRCTIKHSVKVVQNYCDVEREYRDRIARLNEIIERTPKTKQRIMRKSFRQKPVKKYHVWTSNN